ncbi:hypothetical protein LQZ18_00780 [Lachnospiraceae bacterium ZAX-1]
MRRCFVLMIDCLLLLAGKRMRRCFVLMIACLLLLAGCGGSPSSAKLLPENPKGTKAVILPENAEPVQTENEGVADTKPPTVNTLGSVVEIKEKMFIAQCNDIYLNPKDYAGKTIHIEGMYDEYTDEAGTLYRAVIRNGPGCCGNDGVAGFEFSCDGTPDCKQNDWISIEGIITPFTYDDGYETVIIGVANVTVKVERGAEYVNQ